MAVLDEDFQRLWSLLAELSAQLTANREQCETLKRQTLDLKTQAVHTGTGYALRRFNVDLSKEVFESELERMNASLVVENQTLQHENRQLSVLLKDYETTLEQVMGKFRAHAHSTQAHELDLVKHYESALLSSLSSLQQQPANSAQSTPSVDPAFLASLSSLSSLINATLRSLQDEDAPAGYERREHDPSQGGYIGERGGALDDEVLGEEIELARLRRENSTLREMLGIEKEVVMAEVPTVPMPCPVSPMAPVQVTVEGPRRSEGMDEDLREERLEDETAPMGEVPDEEDLEPLPALEKSAMAEPEEETVPTPVTEVDAERVHTE